MVNVKALGLALGILWGAGMFLVGMLNLICGWGNAFQEMMASFYIGFDATFLGAIIGGVWGFVDAFIGGAIAALLYNCFAKKREPKGPAVE